MAELGYRAPIHLMTSGGSLASLETAARFPVRLVESGPAGGAILAGRIALERGERRILSFDMGGTTAKICLIDDGEPLKGRAFEVDRQSRFKKGSGTPVRIPVHRDGGDRRRRRLDCPRRRPAAHPGRARQRRRRAGPGLLRPRRHRADRHGRRPRHRQDRPGALRRRQDRDRSGQGRGGAGGRRSAPSFRHVGRAGRRRRRRDRRREHGQCRARARGRARRRHRRAHAGGLRRRGAPARQPARREARHRAHHRAAGRGRRLGGRLPGGAGRLRDRALALHAARHLRCGGRRRADRRHAARGRGARPRRGRRAARAR